MAADWIKMRSNLWDDPRVAKIVDMTDSSEAAVVGALYWLWATADQHTADGIMPGLSLRQIDRKTGVPGFAEAMCAVGWLADHPDGVRLVDFEKHNGSSAKKRCQTAKRVANHESANADLTRTEPKTNAASVSTALARERERVREEKEEYGEGEQPAKAARPSARKKCPTAFALTPEMRSWASENHPAVDVDRATEKFRDHEFSRALSDWPAAWRNWIRKDAEFATPRPFSTPANTSFRERDEAAAKRRVEEFTGRSSPPTVSRMVFDVSTPNPMIGPPQ